MSDDELIGDEKVAPLSPACAFPLSIDVGPDGTKLERFLAKNLQAITAIVSQLIRETAEQIMTLDLSDDVTESPDWLEGVPNSFAQFVHADKRFLIESELMQFFIRAYAMTLSCTPGIAVHGKLVARMAGMASAMKRARNVKRDFQLWAREQCRIRELPKKGWKSLLVREFLKEVRPEGQVTAAVLKKYLTPSEGFLLE